MHKQMILRSEVKKEAKQEKPKPRVEDLPFITYEGKVHYLTNMFDCALACDKMLLHANNSEKKLIIGFDMEWPFSFQSGPGKTALIQISPSLDECFLFHIGGFKKLPAVLTHLLGHPNVSLTGVNIRNDVHKLARDFPGIQSQPILDNCIDLRTIAKESSCLPNGKMSTLVNHFLGKQINKDNSVRQSQWHKIPLTEAQKTYAAIDAYVSLKLYFVLLKRQCDKLSSGAE